jgi:hypothetical protein
MGFELSKGSGGPSGVSVKRISEDHAADMLALMDADGPICLISTHAKAEAEKARASNSRAVFVAEKRLGC